MSKHNYGDGVIYESGPKKNNSLKTEHAIWRITGPQATEAKPAKPMPEAKAAMSSRHHHI